MNDQGKGGRRGGKAGGRDGFGGGSRRGERPGGGPGRGAPDKGAPNRGAPSGGKRPFSGKPADGERGRPRRAEGGESERRGPRPEFRPRPERGEQAPRMRTRTDAAERPLSGRSGAQESERIARVMARAGLCSRREAEEWIEGGRVTVNGRPITSPALDVTPNDVILVDNKPLPARERTRLWLHHKPRGLVTTADDPEGRATVFDELPPELPRVISIGRLDINTEGLLLLTNDGGLARVLSHPSTGWLRRYRVRAHGRVDLAALAGLKDGISIDGIDYEPIIATVDRQQGDNCWLTMDLTEGKNREIKRVLEHLGLQVTRLIRVSFGPFQLSDMAPGAVEEVRTRTLQDQLGRRLAEEAEANFEAPVFRADQTADDEPTKHKRYVSREEFQERRRKAALGGDDTVKVERGNVSDRKGRTVQVERIRVERPEEEERPDHHEARGRGRPGGFGGDSTLRRPGRDRDDERRPPRADGERRYGQAEGGANRFSRGKPEGERPFRQRPDGDRPYRGRPEGDRPFRQRPDGDRPYRGRAEGDRPFRQRPDGDRPQRGRPEGDRPFRQRPDGDRPQRGRPEGDRPFRQRPDGDRPQRGRPEGDRPFRQRPDGDRPQRGRPEGDRPFRQRPDGDRPYRGRPEGDRPFRQRPDGDRPQRGRPEGDRPFRQRPDGDRPQARGGGERGRFGGGGRGGGKPAFGKGSPGRGSAGRGSPGKGRPDRGGRPPRKPER